MRKMMRHYSLLLWTAACICILASCRTVVPEPTMPVSASDSPVPQYSLHNIGPQRVNASRSILLTDLNQDGNLDLLIGGRGVHHQGFRIEWGDGKGRWSLERGPATLMQPRALAVSGISKNGVDEVVIGGEGGTRGLQVWDLDTKTHEWRLQSAPEQSGVFAAIRFADINEDGWPDLIALRMDSEQNGGIYVYLNDGKYHWIRDVGPMVEGRFTGIAVADVNGDGHLDVIASRRAGIGASRFHGEWHQVGGVQVWYGDGQGRWELEDLPAVGDAESVTVADVNGDGKPDIIAGLYLHGITAWLRDGKSWDRKTVTDKGTWASVRVGDLDHDGQQDLVAASTDGRGIGLWKCRDGDFKPLHGLVPDYGIYSQVDLGDVLHSGKLAIAALRADGAVEVWSDQRAAKEPIKSVAGTEVGQSLAALFSAGSATLTPTAMQGLGVWLKGLPAGGKGLHFRVDGYADGAPVHSAQFPDDAALSRARAESMVAWLKGQDVDEQRIEVVSPGAASLPHQSGWVVVRAYRTQQVRLPAGQTQPQRDLFHIDHNAVFKTVNGVPEYRVGPGDELVLTIWEGGKPTANKVVVQADGTVAIPYFDALHIGGLTSTEIDAYVTKAMAKYIIHPRVDVQILKEVSKTANISGEVQGLGRQPTGPGTYTLTGKETLTEFLSRVGGAAKDADLTRVQIVRHGQMIILNLQRAIEDNDWRENAIVDDGDRIYIPSLAQSKHRVYVLGAVKQPGIVEYNGDIRFLDAISKKQGFSDSAYLKDIRIIRQDRDRPLIIPVAFNRFMERGDLTQNPELHDHDVIIVPDEPIANWNKMIAKLMPTVSAVLTTGTTINEVYTVRDLLRGTTTSTGATTVLVK